MTTFGDILKKAAEAGSSFEILEAGQYVAKIIESEYKDSTGGKPQIKTRWEVVVGPKAGFKGLWNYFTLTVDNPNAMAIFYRQMTALGITSDFMQSLANVDPVTAMKHIAQALDGRMAMIKVKVDTEWQNNKIERINPLPAEMAASIPTVPSNDPFAQAAAQSATPAPVAQAPVPVATPPVAPVTAPPASAPVVTAPVVSAPATEAPVAPVLPPPPF